MKPGELKTFLRERAVSAGDDYVRDIDALDHEHLSRPFAGKARTMYDVSFEVAKVNRRVAMRLSGDDPGPWEPAAGWTVAPEDMLDKAKMVTAVSESIESLVKAWDDIPDDQLTREIIVPSGKTSPLELMFMACYHTGYHGGQLNYVQSLYGDDQIHWADA